MFAQDFVFIGARFGERAADYVMAVGTFSSIFERSRMLLVRVKSCWEQTLMVFSNSPCSLESGVNLNSEQVPITQASGVLISRNQRKGHIVKVISTVYSFILP